MRFLGVHPGASWATADVWDGLTGALRRKGHEIKPYALGYWLDVAGAYLNAAWQEAKAANPDTPRFTDADVLAWASKDILIQALRHDPDWVLIVSAMYVHPDVLGWLKRCNFRVAIVLTESPYDDGPQGRAIRHADVAFTNERSSVEFLRHFNPNTHYLPHGYDPDRHHPPSSSPEGEAGVPSHDVVLVGTGFAERVALLEAVDWSGIDLGLYGTWNLIDDDSPLKQYVRGGVIPNERAAELYRAAKIGLNLYRRSYGYGHEAPQVNTGESLNPRALELAANGVFTISDRRPEVEEVFGDVVPVFDTAEELEWLIRHYLTHETDRCDKAAALPALVAGRTFDTIAERLLSALHGQGG